MSEEKHQVVIVDVKMPFWSIVLLMVKLTLAAIPAFLILAALGSVVAAILGMIFGGSVYWWHGRMM